MGDHLGIAEYVRTHPETSDRMIRRRFGVSRQDIARLRAALSENRSSALSRRIDSLLSGYRPYASLFFIALTIRLAALPAFHAHPETVIPILDASYYISWAEDILSEGVIGTRPFFTEPLYAYLLALFLKLSPHGAGIMVGFQILLGAILPIIVMRIGETALDRQTGFLAGLLGAIYAPFIFYEHVLLKTALETFLLPAFFLALIAALKKASAKPYIFLGALLGILTLIKGNGLVFIPLVAIAIAKNPLSNGAWKSRATLFSCFIIGFFLILSPATIRNLIVSESFMLTNYSLGMNLYQGNFHGSDGALLQPAFIRPDPRFEEADSNGMAEAYAGQPLAPNEISSFWIRKTFDEIASHPKDWAMLVWNKLLLFLNRYELGDNYVYGFAEERIAILRALPGFAMLAPFGIAGLLLAFLLLPKASGNREDGRRFFLALLAASLAAYAATVILFHPNARYRLPAMPLLLIFSAASLRYIAGRAAAGKMPRAVSASLLCLVAFGTSAVPLKNLRAVSAADPYNNLGIEAMGRGDHASALGYFEAGRMKDPGNLISWRNIFLLSIRSGNRESARQALLRELKLRPDDVGVYKDLALFEDTSGLSAEETAAIADERQRTDQESSRPYDPDFYEGWRLFNDGRYEEAERRLLLSSAKLGNPEETLFLLALAKKSIAQKKDGRAGSDSLVREAEELLRSIVGKNRRFLPAQYQLGLLYAQQGKYAKAAELFGGIHGITDDYLDNWYYYGLSSAYAKDSASSRHIMQSFIDRYQDDPSRRTHVERFRTLLEESKAPIR